MTDSQNDGIADLVKTVLFLGYKITFDDILCFTEIIGDQVIPNVTEKLEECLRALIATCVVRHEVGPL